MKNFVIREVLFFLILLAVIVAGVFVVRHIYPYDELAIELWAVTGFFGLFGALYAIIAGFTIYIARLRFLDLSALTEKELNELEVIRDMTNIYLKDHPSRPGILKALSAYADSVIHKEWPQMSGHQPVNSDTSSELYDLMRSVDAIKPVDANDGMAMQNLMEKVGAITVLRTERLNLSHEKLPPPVTLLILVMSFIIILGALLIAVKDLFINLFVVISTTFSAWLIHYIIVDLDNPFVGFWNVRDTQFRKFVETLPK